MAIAFGRFGRLKRFIIGSIIGFFRGIKNGIVRTIRGGGGGGSRGDNGTPGGGGDIIALEVTDEKDFQVLNLLSDSGVSTVTKLDHLLITLQGENGDLKNRGLKVEINHLPLGGDKSGGQVGSANNIADNFPDSSIGEGMDITIHGANGHVMNHNAVDNQSLKSDDSRPPDPTATSAAQQAGAPSAGGAADNDDKLNNKYSDMSIGLGMDISIRGDGDATTTKEAAVSGTDENGWGISHHSSLQFDDKEALDGEEMKEVDGDIISQTEIKHVEEVLYDPVDDVVVEDCCPEICYRVCPCCIGDPDSPFWQLWYRHRLQVSRLVLLSENDRRCLQCIALQCCCFKISG
jgi:hypothetical protein